MRKRLGIVITVLALGVAGCGDDNGNPNNPSAIRVFTVPLSAQSEVPAITNAERDARGTAVITFNTDANTVDFNVSLNSFPNDSVVRIAHIHGPAPRTGNASIVVDTSLAAGTVALVNGAGTFSFPGRDVPKALMDQILAAPQNYYFNVHTVLNGGGAVRGQLQ
jgi:hypothetical protein